jgi:hypothetical protein
VLRTCLIRTSTETSAILTEGFRDFPPASQTSDEINSSIELCEGTPLLGTPKDVLSKVLEMGVCFHRGPAFGEHGGTLLFCGL